MKLDQHAQMPLYKQVMAEIQSDIQKGIYPPGSKIPSEAEISQLYAVSRVTVRRAIEELSGMGYLTSRQGKGTFVRRHGGEKEKLALDAKASFASACRDRGIVPEVRVINRCVVPVAQQECPFFGASHDSLVSVSCLGLVDDAVIAFEDSFLSFEDYENLLEEDLGDFSPLEYCAGSISACSVQAISATTSLAKLLHVGVGDAVLLDRIQIRTDAGAPLCLMNRYVVGSRAQLAL